MTLVLVQMGVVQVQMGVVQMGVVQLGVVQLGVVQTGVDHNLLYLKQSPTPPFSATEYICHTFALCATLQHNLWLLSYFVCPCTAALLQICFPISSKFLPLSCSALKFVITIKSIGKQCHCLSLYIPLLIHTTNIECHRPSYISTHFCLIAYQGLPTHSYICSNYVLANYFKFDMKQPKSNTFNLNTIQNLPVKNCTVCTFQRPAISKGILLSISHSFK